MNRIAALNANDLTPQAIRDAVLRHLRYSLGKDDAHASVYDWRIAVSLALRDLIVDPWFASTRKAYEAGSKRVYYLSMEFLVGRTLFNAAVNLGVDEAVGEAIAGLGQDPDVIIADEPDAALGNGGLGRLAACILESLSTLGYPAFGYGIRYENGLFRQRFRDGRQVEIAEDWLAQRQAWQFERPEAAYEIGFGGYVGQESGRAVWHPDETIVAAAYDLPVIGWRGRWANTLRLWSARSSEPLDLERFNRGEYLAAAESEELARTISRVLYPDDTTDQGKQLRLRQEYFFTAASIQDLMRRFRSEYRDMRLLPEKVVVQLNDTHPAIAAPELVRLLMDHDGLDFDTAADIAEGCLAYTNHTLLPEALEQWPEALLADTLPRHHQIIGRLDERHRARSGGVARIVEDRMVKMGVLAFATAHRVNGVSQLHTDIMRETVFGDLNRAYPDRIVNQTNGVTPRRWLYAANPPLRRLLNDTIGTAWQDDLERLGDLENHVDDPSFIDAYAAAKRANKLRLAGWLQGKRGVAIDPEAMFDVHIKRLHEYKRQLMNILETIALWNDIRDNPAGDWTPRVKIFGGKAAPGYVVAKQIIRLINDAAAVINRDPKTRDLLQIVFPENYNVSMAELLIPATDLSEQISTAGKEASGTGNMKLALNGAPTIGTLDGANIEIRDRVGDDNFFEFGLEAHDADARRLEPEHGRAAISASHRLTRVLDQIAAGRFSPGEENRYGSLVTRLYEDDYFLVCSDFDAYFDRQRDVDAAYRHKRKWFRMAALNTARMGWFSSDRLVRGYARDVWDISPLL